MFLSNIPPSSTQFLHHSHTCSSFQFESLAALPLLILLLLKHSSYLQHILLHILHANVWANANPACRMCLLSWRGSICFVLHLSKAFLTSFFLVCCCSFSVLPAALLKLFISQQHAEPIYPHRVRHHNTTVLSLHLGLWVQSYASKHFWESLREKYHGRL